MIERFMRTLKEQRLWLHRFMDLAHAEREIAAFIERCNAGGGSGNTVQNFDATIAGGCSQTSSATCGFQP